MVTLFKHGRGELIKAVRGPPGQYPVSYKSLKNMMQSKFELLPTFNAHELQGLVIRL